jgi:alkanesulfonate monooxygenase SsuD/methylene tetrahydromethanopterin reductase-like flavin-dependent oxidoreductase (luciferase family)
VYDAPPSGRGDNSSGVNVGVYFDLRNPPGWRRDSSRLYGFTLEMCEEAERLGAHSVWVSEHHLFEDGYLPQTLTYAAAIAARTKRVRVGTAILIAPLHPAVQIAEEAAVVDLVSGGRLELGLGAGYRVPEFALYGADVTRRYGTTDNRARELRQIWADGAVTPAPAQQRVPIWMGYQGPKGARRAGLLGENLLSANAALYEPYRQGLIDGGHDPAIARMAGGIQGWISEDPEADWPTVAEHLRYQVDSYRRYAVEGTENPVPRPIDPDRLRTHPVGRILGSFLQGTPEEAARQIKEHAAGAPVETVYIFASLAGMPEEMVARHVQTICTRLGPLLAAD